MYSLGVRPETKQIVVAKGVQSRARYAPIAAQIILVNTPGLTSADLSSFTIIAAVAPLPVRAGGKVRAGVTARPSPRRPGRVAVAMEQGQTTTAEVPRQGGASDHRIARISFEEFARPQKRLRLARARGEPVLVERDGSLFRLEPQALRRRGHLGRLRP